MTYTLDESYTSPNQTPHDSCPAAFGYARNIIGTTIHHWDRKDSGATWAGTIATLTNDYRNPGSRGVSAHFVVETGRAACLVSPWDAAWHAGNPQGNAQTVGIELNPDESAGTYQTAAEVIARLWFDWGIPHDLFPHVRWTQTECPGGYDLGRLRSMAETEYTKLNNQGDAFSMATIDDLAAAIKRPDVLAAIATAVLAKGVPWQGKDGKGSTDTTSLQTFLKWNDSDNGWIRNKIDAATTAATTAGTNAVAAANNAGTNAVAAATTAGTSAVAAANNAGTSAVAAANAAGTNAVAAANAATAAVKALPAATPVALTDAQIASIADQIKASLPAATVAALAAKLA